MNFLLQEAGRGDLSYTKVRKVAQVMKKELKVTYGINEIRGGAEAAEGIRHAKNAQRDLLRRYPCTVPIRYIDVPLRRSMRDDRQVVRRMPVVLPRELIPELAKKGLLASANIREYWQHAEATQVAWAQAHPAIGRKAHRPLGLYGDDAQFNQHQDKLVIVTLSDVLSTASHSMSSGWPLFVLREALSCGYDTMQAYMQPIAMSMNILFHGKCPGSPMHMLDNFGEEIWKNQVLPSLTEEPLASIDGEPVIATLAEIRGDWKFIKAWFNMSVGWQCKEICFQCHMTNKNYLQFPSPLLSLPERDHQSFMNCLRPDSHGRPSAITWMYGFHHQLIRWCSLHCINLGYMGWVGASTMEFLLEQDEIPIWGSKDETLAQRLMRAYQDFTSWARVRGIQHSQPPFKANFFRGGEDYHAMAAKGYNARCIIAWLSDVCQQLMLQHPADDRKFRLVSACVYNLGELMNVVERSPRYLSLETAQRIQQLIDRSTRAYAHLAADGLMVCRLIFPLKPKLHAIQELGRWVLRDRINFRMYHTFSDEDLNGRVVRVAKSVGTQNLEVATLRRYFSWLEYKAQEGFEASSDAEDA